jgi:hypothetical protein
LDGLRRVRAVLHLPMGFQIFRPINRPQPATVGITIKNSEENYLTVAGANRLNFGVTPAFSYLTNVRK